MTIRFTTALVRIMTALFLLSSAGFVPASAAPAAAPDSTITIDARDFPTGDPLANFNFIINVDNTKLPDDPFASITESHSPIVKIGDQANATVSLPDGRYLISVRSLGHKMWGKHITLPQDAGTVRIDLTVQDEANPLPLGKIRVFVFEDTAWTNGAPDTEELGLNGFQVGLEEQTGNAVTVDYLNNPLCGGVCLTGTAIGPEGPELGFVQIDNLGPATYFIDVHPPAGSCNDDPDSRWYQTTTIDGGLKLQAGVEEGSDGTGAPGEQLWEPPLIRTAFWFGFVCAPTPFATPGTGEIVGTALNWQGWPPFDTLTLGEPVQNPFIALSDTATDQMVYVGQGDSAGNFDIQGVPAGSYNLAIWDEQLSYIIRFLPVTVANGQFVDLNQFDPVSGNSGIGVSRWFGWLDGYAFKDLNGDQIMDPGEPGIANTDMDQRWRDGSIKEATFTGPDGYYEYPTAEGGPLGKWFINEQGFGRFGVSGSSVHDEHTGAVSAVPTDLGGALLNNQLIVEGHRATVDWGKVDYPPGTPGQIVGVTYWATTRNEFNAALQAHEDYEPGIPNVTVLLEGLGPDLIPNTSDDVVLNEYNYPDGTDHWKHPSTEDAPLTQDCSPIRDASGADISGQLNPIIGPNCLEVPLNGLQSKDGAFDGGYAFADYCPESIGGFNRATGVCMDGSDPVPLIAGDYIVHSIMPTDPTDTRTCNPINDGSGYKNLSGPFGDEAGAQTGCLYRIVREEDVNVDLGNQFVPQIPPPPCIGDDHVLDQSTLVTRSPYFGDPSAHAPLCDKKLIVLEDGQNANADFNMMTNFRTDPNGEDPGDTRTGDVHEPGRIVGLVSNDIYFETDPMSIWYGEARPIGGIPVGIYARVDTVPNVNLPYDANNWRLFTTVYTSLDGTYEVLLPSTETFNCPIPQGPCPGMYIVKVNDPGAIGSPNPGYDPNLLTAAAAWDVWPGLTTQLDTPLDPISGVACQDPTAPDAAGDEPLLPVRPDLLKVSKPYVLASDTGVNRQITIQADFIGSRVTTTPAGGRVILTDLRTGQVTTLSGTDIVSWTEKTGNTPDTIVIQVPLANASNFRPGPKQLTIVRANANGGGSSVNGLTLHVLGSNGTGGNLVTYNPPVVNVPPPPPNGAGSIQSAINSAAPGSLIVLSAGTYNENVLLWKPVKLQGLGPGGIIGALEVPNRSPEDPRFNVPGSIIDGRFFAQNAAAFDATVSAYGPFAVDSTLPDILRGADITVVAQSTSAYNIPSLPANRGIFSAARLDGLGLITGRGEGAGGIQLQANINNMQITNTVLENNGGVVAGAIGLGQPYAHQSHNYNVRMAFNRVLGNGGLASSGGIGIFYGSNNYEVANSLLCGNFSVVYGAGLSHIGLSPNGSIRDNLIYYNDAVDSGAGIAIESELPVGGGLGDGSGAVNIDRNVIHSNYSGDDGGGIFVMDTYTAAINIRNNIIANNGASDLGGAVTLDDSANVRFINNTVTENVSTASGESSAIGMPRSAGLASEANNPLFQATLPPGAPNFSDPVALFNNIFWNNNAFTLTQFSPGAVLVDQGFIDFEIHDPTNGSQTYTNARYNLLTNGNVEQADGTFANMSGGPGNIVGVDPLFAFPFSPELAVSGSRLDPQAVAVTIIGQDPPEGLLLGNYRITAASTAIDHGVGFSNMPASPPLLQTPNGGSILAPCSGTAAQSFPADFDRQLRPQLRIDAQVRTPWDLGADELPGTFLAIPGSYTQGPDATFNWNGSGQLQCSASTIP